MAFQTERVESIIKRLASSSVEERLKAIEEAQENNKGIFCEGLSDSEWAYRAMVIESQYNLIRDILKENFKKLSPAQMSEALGTEPKKRGPKPAAGGPKKKLPLNQDPAFINMMKEMFTGGSGNASST